MRHLIKAFILFALMLSCGCDLLNSNIPEGLEDQVKEEVARYYASQNEGDSIAVKSVNLDHLEGDNYSGVVTLEKLGIRDKVKIDVEFDGITLYWELDE